MISKILWIIFWNKVTVSYIFRAKSHPMKEKLLSTKLMVFKRTRKILLLFTILMGLLTPNQTLLKRRKTRARKAKTLKKTRVSTWSPFLKMTPLSHRKTLLRKILEKGRQWRSWSVLTRAKSIMLRVCAITAITSMEEAVSLMPVLIQTDLFTLKENAKTAIWMITTSKRENLRKTSFLLCKLESRKSLAY